MHLIDPYLDILKRDNFYIPKKDIVKTQEFERKKCKSCAAYQESMHYGMCAFPNQKACRLYEKRKK